MSNRNRARLLSGKNEHGAIRSIQEVLVGRKRAKTSTRIEDVRHRRKKQQNKRYECLNNTPDGELILSVSACADYLFEANDDVVHHVAQSMTGTTRTQRTLTRKSQRSKRKPLTAIGCQSTSVGRGSASWCNWLLPAKSPGNDEGTREQLNTRRILQQDIRICLIGAQEVRCEYDRQFVRIHTGDFFLKS